MPISNDNLNKELYNLLRTQGFDPVPKDSKGDTTPIPDEAEVFKFTFKNNEKPIAPAWITVDSNNDLKVYYNDKIFNDRMKESDEDHDYNFKDFLKQLKRWSQRRQLGFDLENQDHLAGDMARREHMKKTENIYEGYYPINRTTSYNDSIPTVKIVLQHTRQIQEHEQRFRHVSKIFLENTNGERILAPTTRPGIAQIYARHLAEGGVPNDERWNHLKSLCEEYQKMAGFVRAVKNKQFNESAQGLVDVGMTHYQTLRETLSKMRNHKGYHHYFESYTPTLMETENDDTTLNELFVQETLDPRIESVIPILNKLHRKVSEMSEVNDLRNWADKITEVEDMSPEQAKQFINKPAVFRKQEKFLKSKDDSWKVTPDILSKSLEPTDMAKRATDVGIDEESEMEEDIGPEQKRVGQVSGKEKAKTIKGYIGKPNQPHPFQGKLVGASESVEHINEDEEREYVCVHTKKGKCEVKASSSYDAAKKAMAKWNLKSTAGIDCYLADKPVDTSQLEENIDELDYLKRLIK